MFIVITGGSGSGKSAFAEEQILRLSSDQRIYIATMMCFDEESKRRIARHRQMRKEKHFETIECYTGLEKLQLPEGATVLLECMSNLTANEMYDPSGAGEQTVERILEGVCHLRDTAKHVCVVTNEVFSDGQMYDPDTMRYLAYLGKINCEMAKIADEVYEVVYGIALRKKGGEKL
ncbi:MAG: bifunctional adenosylcobinamide kinase/adenosylcobinamide-phosphate guanylyltransferase [Lachnospiraceae bacterium]|nr:bifunctional adenosylcobinamide kinase/adenosylcobinamide-phosphate guanylyltransferase [Robinsoniella sp.]MDY3767648.1 bifunctional adenosylcobinamide kinase/adenosylcobinamide-phosphate guanylyltransferase [Lachnospiraceae bacterium]